MRFPTRLIGPLFCIAAAAAFFVLLLIFSADAREVTTGTAVTLLGIVTSPFVLEATCASLLFMGVLAYNRWRREKDGDDWVYLVSHETDDPAVSPTITQRLQSTVLTEKPQPLDEIEAATHVLEGYLELGMPSQALAELNQLPSDEPALVPLRLRILSANLHTDEAVNLLRQSAAASPESLASLVHASIENARWLLQHLQRRDLASRWLQEAGLLHPVKLSSDDPLHALLPEPA